MSDIGRQEWRFYLKDKVNSAEGERSL